MVPIPIAILKARGHSDLQMTMHYVFLGKCHIREQAEKRKHDPRPIDLVQAIPPYSIKPEPPEIELYPEGKNQVSSYSSTY